MENLILSLILRRELMKMLYKTARGKKNALPREELLHYLWVFKHDLNDRDFRKLYTALPICSCDHGLFIPETASEVQEFKAYLTKQSGPFVADRRVRIIYASRPELAPEFGRQQELFG